MKKDKQILSVKNLNISFTQYYKGLRAKRVNPIKSLSVTINAGEIMAVIGASGSGKSLLAHAILGILPNNATCGGDIIYCGEPLTEERKIQLRGKEISFIPQSVNYLDPLMRVSEQVKIGLPKKEADKKQKELFLRYGLKEKDGALYPFQLSGGMLRRVLFATSVRDNIKLVIADEPTPGIHPEALSAMLNQLRTFADDGAAVMLITHDIVSALTVCDRVTVLKDGQTIETTMAENFSLDGRNLKHEYSRALWNALPQNSFSIYKEV
ncbi:ATP-binding cassette domain-containing protein [Maledivibacter halophilus]|uniref:Nickel import system ATP-binding protein NikD n=1 Tax=Maledivibacter halophilus TaxID=36842 RepID=A0A1T5JSW4_9FIRM|nr:ABC transporter ATP-binding protein [Maledivibacter halophilus]SKC54288.1 peptide/nickel transport system ATP-binding protein [Maledivibacter halophilus]